MIRFVWRVVVIGGIIVFAHYARDFDDVTELRDDLQKKQAELSFRKELGKAGWLKTDIRWVGGRLRSVQSIPGCDLKVAIEKDPKRPELSITKIMLSNNLAIALAKLPDGLPTTNPTFIEVSKHFTTNPMQYGCFGFEARLR